MSCNRKSDTLKDINDQVMKFNPHQDINMNAKLHVGLNSIYLQLRQEVHSMAQITLAARKQRLTSILKNDFQQEDKNLRRIGLAYINTQP